VFEPFTQVDGSVTRAHGGLGQGLALVRAVAQALGGEVGVTASALGGARFYLLLPMTPLGLARALAPPEPPAARACGVA
jgi:signal transduction histidine kinase